jgi:hypothetical protein
MIFFLKKLRNETKIPVELVFGYQMSPIEQTKGGGKRNIYLNKNETFFNVLNKITELYFKSRFQNLNKNTLIYEFPDSFQITCT